MTPDDGDPAPNEDAAASAEETQEAEADPAPADSADTVDAPEGGSGGREVVVPMRLYKTVTVVATLLAMVGVVGGFVLLDAATGRGSASSLREVDPVVALLGLAFIVGGAATYAYSTRFRAAGMGRSKTDEDEPPGDG